MNGYICFYGSRRCEVHAESLIQARDLGVKEFQKRQKSKVKPSDVSAHLAEKNGVQVTTTPDF
jgi:hypothetical protein